MARMDVRERLAWISAIREPAMVMEWSLPEWERAVRLGRRLRLLGRLAESLDSAGLLLGVPELPRRHLVSEQRLSRHRTAMLVWALERIRQSLEARGTEPILLKGAAYLAQGLAIASGRLPSDIDILVPREDIPTVCGLLSNAGWQEVALDEHDRRYYHEWSHEVPPLVHPVHPIELDVHHNIVPPMARSRVDAGLLFAGSRSTPWHGWRVLAPLDQVLHSAAHLFFDSDVRDRVRDMVDLDSLLRHFGMTPGFWEDLPRRARELDLAEPMALACHFCTDWLETPVPELASQALQATAGLDPGRSTLVEILRTALLPLEPDEAPSWRTLAAGTLVQARYHRWRLPLAQTVSHLFRKTLDRRRAH
jgi:hypothetical protein